MIERADRDRVIVSRDNNGQRLFIRLDRERTEYGVLMKGGVFRIQWGNKLT